MWDLTIHPPSGPSVFAGTRSLLQSMWDPPIHPPLDPSVLAGTPPCVHPLRGSTSSLAHRPMSGSCTICNSLSPPLADIVLFGLPLKVFKTCLLGRGFHTLIKSASFFSSTDVESHRKCGRMHRLNFIWHPDEHFIWYWPCAHFEWQLILTSLEVSVCSSGIISVKSQ